MGKKGKINEVVHPALPECIRFLALAIRICKLSIINQIRMYLAITFVSISILKFKL